MSLPPPTPPQRPRPPEFPQAIFYFSPSPPPPAPPPVPPPSPFAPIWFTSYGQDSGEPGLASTGLVLAIVCGVSAVLLCSLTVIWLVRRAQLRKSRIGPAIVPQVRNGVSGGFTPPRHGHQWVSHKGGIKGASQGIHNFSHQPHQSASGTHPLDEDQGTVCMPQTVGLWQPFAGLTPGRAPQQHSLARVSATMHTDPSTAGCCRMQALPHGHGAQGANFRNWQMQQLPHADAAQPASAHAHARETSPPRLPTESLSYTTPAADSTEPLDAAAAAPRWISPGTQTSAKFGRLMSTGPLSSPSPQYDWDTRAGQQAHGHGRSRWVQ